MSDTVIKVENLSKLYRLGEVGTGTISHDLNRWWARMRGREDPLAMVGQVNDRTKKAQKGESVWALKDINFEVKQGEILGIIGKNGAGKSTLLKLLSRVTAPSQGSIKVKGRIASLLEVGTGMHPEMTGRENVFLNGTILGMTRKEIASKFDDIMDFAGCSKYADTPVKRYSSGMKVRLGFAVAAFLEPEILIVDEVLAVGDAEFQKRAIGKMKEVSQNEGRTVLFVSHNMSSIKTLCNKCIMMEKGQVARIGDTEEIIHQYLNKNLRQNMMPILNKREIDEIAEGVHKNNSTLKINKVSVTDERGEVRSNYFSNEKIILKIWVQTTPRVFDMRVIFEIVNEFNNSLLLTQASDSGDYLEYIEKNRIDEGEYEFTCEIPANLLSEHRYYLSIQVINPKQEHIVLPKALYFDVKFTGYNGVMYGSFSKSLLRPSFEWHCKKLELSI